MSFGLCTMLLTAYPAILVEEIVKNCNRDITSGC